MRDYITTAFTLVVGLLNSDKLVYLALIGLGLLVIWQLLSLLTSFNNKLAKKCRKISKFLSTRGLSAQNYNAFLALVAKMPQEFIRGYKTFEHASYGLPSDYIKRFDSIDVEVNGGVFNHGKSVQKWFIAVWSMLLFVLSLALMGEDATLTPYALADALVLPVLFWIVAKLFYYIFTAIRQQQYRVAVDEFNEMLDIMNDKIENNDDLPGPDVLAEGYDELENDSKADEIKQSAQSQKVQPAEQEEKEASTKNAQEQPQVVPAMSAITRAELAKVYGEVNAQMGQNFASATSQVEPTAEEPAHEEEKVEDTFSEEELAEPITDAETESVIDNEMQQIPKDFWGTNNSSSSEDYEPKSTQRKKDFWDFDEVNEPKREPKAQAKSNFWNFDQDAQPKAEPKTQAKSSFWNFDEAKQPKNEPKAQTKRAFWGFEDDKPKSEKSKFVWDISGEPASADLKENAQTVSSQNVEENAPAKPETIDTVQNIEYNDDDVSQAETKNTQTQSIVANEKENFVEQEENNEVKRGRGRPKKLPEGEVVITTDEQFEEALERAEKLMRKSEEALSASQAKRVEKSLKDLMDAMTKYKEEH